MQFPEGPDARGFLLGAYCLCWSVATEASSLHATNATLGPQWHAKLVRRNAAVFDAALAKLARDRCTADASTMVPAHTAVIGYQ